MKRFVVKQKLMTEKMTDNQKIVRSNLLFELFFNGDNLTYSFCPGEQILIGNLSERLLISVRTNRHD